MKPWCRIWVLFRCGFAFLLLLGCCCKTICDVLHVLSEEIWWASVIVLFVVMCSPFKSHKLEKCRHKNAHRMIYDLQRFTCRFQIQACCDLHHRMTYFYLFFFLSDHLSFKLSFFLHGESTVCSSVEVSQHPPVTKLTPAHLEATANGYSNGFQGKLVKNHDLLSIQYLHVRLLWSWWPVWNLSDFGILLLNERKSESLLGSLVWKHTCVITTFRSYLW